MTTTVVFETATISEAIRAAEKVAPSKGQAFDKAAGIVLEIEPETSTVVVKATNTAIFHMAWVDAVNMEGPSTTWRLPSALFARHMAALPIGSGKEVTFTQNANRLHVDQGRIKARFQLMDSSHYPMWGAFDPDDLTTVKDFGGKVSLIEWAADATEIPISGFYLDGEYVLATDRYRLAAVPLAISELTSPVVVPAGLIGSLFRQTGEVQMRVDETQLLIMPDEYTQYRIALFGDKYPNAKRIMENNRDKPNHVKLRKSALLEVINRAMNFSGTERIPKLRMFIGGEEIGCMMQDREAGMIGDVLELPGQAVHDKGELSFTPKNIVDALDKCPNEEVDLYYDISKPGALVYINGGSGFEAWVMPRKEVGESVS
jgi:DNA polymerase III sliding clamp (beta) subunit (PCNA family)